MNQKTLKINALSSSPITPLRTPLETKKVANWTYEDALSGKCEHWQVGTDIVLPDNLAPEKGPKETVGLFLDAFHALGGVEELVKFGKNNPGKFYDQLLRLLISMDAPKQSAQSTKNLEATSEGELMSMSSADLKRMLSKSGPVD